ncbi:zinc finger MYM-type protein 1-like [Nilaparvata lugens]|uniref:zinc finger MYM-type protein 1-like n=1 Tax=Nilaparvata lugens TaxID=108931 RepID=UPI00193CAFF0|nr:zinc finger MYM-type protein 1-like [Nilaparvata lugens]
MSCVIKSLLERPFSSRSFKEKKYLMNIGRPIPNLPNLMQNCGKFTRHFQSNNYKKYEWLAGSETLNALFCWNCLLFGRDRHTSWTENGFKHLGNLSKSLASHEITVNHICASLCAASIGQIRIETALDDQLKQEILQHNKIVKRNRDLLKRLINAVCFLGKQELAFRGHNEEESSINRGNYIELLKYTADYDPLLAEHLETATVFKGFSSHIQNDLIDAVGSSLLLSIKKELEEANFVAVLVDETTDVSNKAQFSIVFRYVNDGQVKERFLGFTDISIDKHDSAISMHILEFLNKFGCSEKLVAQTYDGASTMAGHLSGVQARIKESHPEALFVHCYAHVLNLVLSQCVSEIPQCKIFFSTLNGIAAFFSRSPKRVIFLDEFLKRRLPNVCPTRWNYSSRLVNTVHKFRKELCEVFQAMLEHPEEIESDILAPVNGFLSVLEKFQFVFLLSVFDKIFCHTDILFDVLQHQASDIVYCRKKLKVFARPFQNSVMTLKKIMKKF